jgi:hypothetical protein
MIRWAAFVHVEWWTRSHRSRRFSLWIPVFIAWLLLLPLVLVLFPVVAIACLLMRVSVLDLYSTAWSILASLGGTRVEVRTPAANVMVNVT